MRTSDVSAYTSGLPSVRYKITVTWKKNKEQKCNQKCNRYHRGYQIIFIIAHS